MKVFKFGGSSVASADHIRDIVSWFPDFFKEERCRAVVFSAFQGVTDQLISMAECAGRGDDSYTSDLGRLEGRHIDTVRSLLPSSEQSHAIASVKFMLNDLEDVLQGVYLTKELTPRSLDFITSFGEQLSNYIIHLAFKHQGIPCDFLDTRSLIVTDDRFGSAEVDMERTVANIKAYFASRPNLQVVTGFIAATEEGVTTTLGRGGSDYTASIFAHALDADELQIWTDVDGVLTSDPRIVQEAFTMDILSYEEAMELSHFGAKVIHPPTIEPAMSRSIPIRIKNTLNPAFPGTLIGKEDTRKEYVIKGISSIDHVALIRIQGSGLVGMAGIATRIFGALAAGSINIILITQASSEHSVCLAVSPKDASKAKKMLEKELRHELSVRRVADIIIEKNLSILAVVGENMRHTPGIAGKVFQALGASRINISAIAQGSSELNISAVIKREDKETALRVIHNAFFQNAKKRAHLYIIGTGLIGKQLITDIYDRQEWFSEKKNLNLEVNGIMNIDNMLLDEKGIKAQDWETRLQDSKEKSNPETLMKYLKKHPYQYSVIVDATASDFIPEWYVPVLEMGMAVVTPNKKANSGSLEIFQKLDRIAKENQTSFLYETNVGAGLPFIQAVRERAETGDNISKIEGVFSGTLSYLFNCYDGKTPFSKLVENARNMGYTEPDPRDDLNGLDAARKLLILARISGYPASLEDIEVENLIPEKLRKEMPADDFLKALSSYDKDFEERFKKANAEGKVLRYMAVMDGKKLRVGLSAVGKEHPFYFLTGTENILALTTDAYSESLFVVRGPGAGARVTANGVLSDILKAIN